MATRYEVLPEAQRRLLPALAGLHALGFVLYGGTAIALRLGHRTSIDFDFFTDRPMDRRALVERAPVLADAQVLQDEVDSLTVLAAPDGAPDTPVKLSFVSSLRFGRVGVPTFDDDHHLLVASLGDLLRHKLKVLLQRVEVKDYVDIAEMLTAGQTLGAGLGAATALFANFPPCEALKALTYFEDAALASLSKHHRALLVDHADRAGTPTPQTIVSRHLDLDGPSRSAT